MDETVYLFVILLFYIDNLPALRSERQVRESYLMYFEYFS